ncbi:3-hydroxybenzoate 6-hydroxylase [Phlyctema vagabunda]|uniref:3-hydroxybenzoate 6-hydroxylase n=1 Tax=Phlyctema vagabunda TaxID=108571 RepID=A0ABR4PTL8_9HELO
MVPQAKLPLEVIIVGAGIGGVAAAVALCRRDHNVTLLESAPQILPIGAGIQVAPNMLRLLNRWGIGTELYNKGIRLQEVHIRRWQDGSILGETPVNMSYGDQVLIHRADLHDALLTKAKEFKNFQLRTDATVVDVDFDHASITIQGGKKVSGDVIIAADGIKSIIRKKVTGDVKDTAIPTGDAVYRLMLTREQMIHDPDLKPFIEEKKAIRWLGPGGHTVSYPVQNHQAYNLAMAHPDRGGVDESWTTVGSKEKLLKEYENWDPILYKMLVLVPTQEVLEWKLCSHIPLSTWTKGNCALLGDACHPMLPYVAQGAAQAVEDAAAIGVILSNLTSRSEIPNALKIYEKARKGRAETIQALGPLNREALHLPDGPEQKLRDAQFQKLSAAGTHPDKWADKKTQEFLWAWDAEVEAEKALKGYTSLPNVDSV